MSPMPPRSLPQLSTTARYALAPGAALLAFAIQLLLLPRPSIAPFVFFYAAVVVASLLGGRGPGLFAVLLSAGIANFAFVPPHFTWSTSLQELTATALFVAASSLVALLCASLRTIVFQTQRLAERFRRQANMLELSHDAILVWRFDTGIESWNRGARDLYGFAADEAIGRVSHDLLQTKGTRDLESILAELRDQRRWEGEFLHTTKDGRIVTVSAKLQIVRSQDGVERVLESNRDVTERKEAEEQVKRLNESLERRNAELDAERMRWQGVVEGIADEVWVCDAKGTVSLVNLPEATASGFEASSGASAGEILEGVEILEFDGQPRPRDQSPLRRALEEGRIIRGEETKRNQRTGAERYRQYSCAPMRDGAGQVTGAVAVVRDITELRLAEFALREADRRKNEFLAMLAHELRNPLNPIGNSLRILDRAPQGGTQARRACEIIDRQLAHMTRLVDELLDVSRIASGKIRLQREAVDLCILVSHTVDDHRPLFADKGISLEAELPTAPLFVDGDPVRLTQALGNVLQNAVKFTPAGGRVRVRVSSQGGWSELSVRDTGAGISPEVIAHIFEPFTQADRTLDRAAGGLGLGLSLVKGLIELHGGAVRASSDGPGTGSELMIRLPIHVGAVADHPQPHVVAAQHLRVLVIEDNVDASESLRDVLELDGHIVELSRSGPDGLEKAREFIPDVVLCDIGLPGMDGYETARAFRAEERLKAISLVALTGYAGSEDQLKARQAGFDHHLAKPLDFTALARIFAGLRSHTAWR